MRNMFSDFPEWRTEDALVYDNDYKISYNKFVIK